MEFSLILDKPKDELSGFTSHAGTLIWENGCGNDCVERFYKRDHVELMREVILSIKNKGYQIVSLDLRQLGSRSLITFHTT